MGSSTKLLSILAVAFMHLFFAIAFELQSLTQLRWVLFYFSTVSFFGALYFRRWLYLRRRRGWVYRGLGYTAVMLGALLSALFFSVDTGMALPLTVGVWLGLAIAFYCFYLIITLHLEEDFVQAQVDVRPPV